MVVSASIYAESSISLLGGLVGTTAALNDLQSIYPCRKPSHDFKVVQPLACSLHQLHHLDYNLVLYSPPNVFSLSLVLSNIYFGNINSQLGKI
jgi:hypothetical protein